MVMGRKTYKFKEIIEERIIIAEDRISRFKFLLIVDENGNPKKPWVGENIFSSFIDGRTFAGPRDFRYLEHLKRETKEAAINYLSRKYDKQKEKETTELLPYWMKRPF